MRAILTYHSIDTSESPISCHPKVFEWHARWLASGQVRVVTLAMLLTLPDSSDAVALTFDDAFANVGDLALPLLRRHGLPSTVFVVTDHVGRTNAWRGVRDHGIPVLPLLDWPAIAGLPEQGVAIGSHSRTHPDLTAVDTAVLEEEVSGSIRMIQRETGVRPTAFAYPYGAVDERTARVVGAVYREAYTTEFRQLDAAAEVRRLPRLDAYYFRRPELLESWGTPGFERFIGRRRRFRHVRAVTRGLTSRMLSWGRRP
jgi:peptidoglycan/xylan/chitin deacetylase (PgdA/CDA1 family)